MTVFRTMFLVCAVLGACASCSGSYETQVDQGSQPKLSSVDHGGITTGQMSSFVSQIQQAISDSQTLSAEQVETRPSIEQPRPGAASAMHAAAPTTTQYLCSCITIVPLATVHHAPASAAPVIDEFASTEASTAYSCKLAGASSSDDCTHQKASQSSPVQGEPVTDSRGTSHSAYAANSGGY